MNCICLSSFMVCVHLRPYVWIYGFNEKNNTTPQNIYIYILSSWLGKGSHTFHHFPPSMSSLRIPKGLPHRHLRPFGIRRALRQFPASLQRPGVAGDAREAPRQAHHCGVTVDHRQVGRTTHGGGMNFGHLRWEMMGIWKNRKDVRNHPKGIQIGSMLGVRIWYTISFDQLGQSYIEMHLNHSLIS